jgi:antitoxin component YwqK of YwqJK toxin-antitoxin module
MESIGGRIQIIIMKGILFICLIYFGVSCNHLQQTKINKLVTRDNLTYDVYKDEKTNIERVELLYKRGDTLFSIIHLDTYYFKGKVKGNGYILGNTFYFHGITEYYSNYGKEGKVKHLIVFKHDKINDIYLENFDNEVFVSSLILNKEDRLSFSIDSSNKVNNIIHYKGNTILNGIYIEFYPNGAIMSNFNYLNQIRTGNYQIYYENGVLKEKGKYSGECIKFDFLEGYFITPKNDTLDDLSSLYNKDFIDEYNKSDYKFLKPHIIIPLFEGERFFYDSIGILSKKIIYDSIGNITKILQP